MATSTFRWHPICASVATVCILVFALTLPTIARAQQPPAIALTVLGTLGGNYSVAKAINEQGKIVGDSGTPTGGQHAFLWDNGVMTDLGTLDGSYSFAYGINNRGQVVGSSITSAGEEHAFLWDNGVMTDLGTLGGPFSIAFAVNERGQVVGGSQTATGAYRAVLWVEESMIVLPGGTDDAAFGINNRGQIAGIGFFTGEQRGGLWTLHPAHASHN